MSVNPTTIQNPPAFAGYIGIGRVEITPPAGVRHRNWGAATHTVATGVHRPLFATALTLQVDEASTPQVLLELDLGWWRSREHCDEIRSGLLERFSLPDSHLLLALTHTHAGPSLERSVGGQDGGDKTTDWLERLPGWCAEAVQSALESAAPARLTWAHGRCGLATNRDFPDPEKDRYLCGWNPLGEADDTLLVGRISDTAGRCRGVLVNYACHPTTLAWENQLLSPDYIGAMRETVERESGGNCLFLLGACGELAPAEQYVGDPAVADRHGRMLGYAVLSTLEGLPVAGSGLRYDGPVESGAPLAIWKSTPMDASRHLDAHRFDVELALKDLPSAAAIEAKLASAPPDMEAYALERLRRLKGIRRLFGDGGVTREGLWLWRIGDAWLAASPFEAYSDLQLRLREAVREPVLVGNVVNGWRGYTPPSSHYERDQYTAWQSAFTSGCLETLIQRFLEGMKAEQ